MRSLSLNITIDSKRQEAVSMLGFSIVFVCVRVYVCVGACVRLHASRPIASPAARPSQARSNQ